MIGAAAAVVILATGTAVRARNSRELKDWTETQAIPTVTVITPAPPASGGALNLPGRLESFTDAPIYARVNGYLKSWRVDIGDRVKAGQVLATIDTPELDQQLLQAKADLASAQADAALAKTSAERWQALLGSDAVSRQEVDDRTQDYAQKKARVAAAQANVDRLVAMKAFATIVAPFDGVITARNTDIGALIDAGSSSHTQLFSVSSVNRLRVYVHVPQFYAPMIRRGGRADFTVPEYPGRRFTADIVGLADAVNASSGTTLVQLQVDNAAHLLLPGSFVTLHFALPVPDGAMRIPASALIFDEHGLRVATVDSHDEVRFKAVAIEQDLGKAVEIGTGLKSSDRVIDTPPDGLSEGDRVRVARNGIEAANHG
ncbi:efflux RND transporter periplasmic adaptor subunit [Paraburkholderia sp. 2C]